MPPISAASPIHVTGNSADRSYCALATMNHPVNERGQTSLISDMDGSQPAYKRRINGRFQPVQTPEGSVGKCDETASDHTDKGVNGNCLATCR